LLSALRRLPERGKLRGEAGIRQGYRELRAVLDRTTIAEAIRKVPSGGGPALKGASGSSIGILS